MLFLMDLLKFFGKAKCSNLKEMMSKYNTDIILINDNSQNDTTIDISHSQNSKDSIHGTKRKQKEKIKEVNLLNESRKRNNMNCLSKYMKTPIITPNNVLSESVCMSAKSYMISDSNYDQDDSEIEDTYEIVDEVIDKQNYGILPHLCYSHPNLGSKIFQFNTDKSIWEVSKLEESNKLPINSKTVFNQKAESIHFIGGYYIDRTKNKTAVDSHNLWAIGSKNLKKLRPMASQRYCFGICFLLDYIYVLGGVSNDLLLKSSERYSIESNSWEQLPDTSNQSCGQVLVPVDFRYIYSFLKGSMANRSTLKVEVLNSILQVYSEIEVLDTKSIKDGWISLEIDLDQMTSKCIHMGVIKFNENEVILFGDEHGELFDDSYWCTISGNGETKIERRDSFPKIQSEDRFTQIQIAQVGELIYILGRKHIHVYDKYKNAFSIIESMGYKRAIAKEHIC